MTMPASGLIDRVVIAGAGAFGTALAIAAFAAGRDVVLWARDRAHAEALGSAGENRAYLPGVPIPAAIRITADRDAFRTADAVLLAAPAQATRGLLGELSAFIPDGMPIIACAKGIEQGSGFLQTDIIAELAPGARPAALSGPGFAEEIAAGLPTAVTIAAGDVALAETLAQALSSEAFRPYASDDLLGAELGGALKNVVAIACGIVAGLRLGESARAALIARGLAEITRLGVSIGARAETFTGLSGLGDLVLTATSGQSRNTRFGMALAGGRAAAELMTGGAPLAEGAHTAGAALQLALRHGVDMPIIAAVAAVIEGRVAVPAAIEALFSRPLRREIG